MTKREALIKFHNESAICWAEKNQPDIAARHVLRAALLHAGEPLTPAEEEGSEYGMMAEAAESAAG